VATPGVTSAPVAKWNYPNLAAAVQSIPAPAGGGQGSRVLYAFYVINNQTSLTAYVQLFDLSTAAGVTLGTTLPDEQLAVAGSTMAFLPIPSTTGVLFTNGIQVASTTLIGGSVGSAAGVYVYALYL
jgi:hypothetical protein